MPSATLQKPQSSDSIRQEKGKLIASTDNCVYRVDDTSYKVRSQSGNTFYDVMETEIGWKCNCPDHKFRGLKCKHIWAVLISLGLRQQARANLILEPVVITECPKCGSVKIRKDGVWHAKHGGDIQRYEYADCGKKFSINLGFEKMKHNPKAITAAMQLYFSGESLRNTQKSLRLLGTDVCHKTISNWIRKYSAIMKQYADNLQPNVSSIWRADEIYIKVKGDLKYLFALMDDETRYWIAMEVADSKERHDARRLLHEGKVIAGRKPETLITDGLPVYRLAFNREYYQNKSPQPQHINAIKFNSPANNNKMERINGEIRDREKTMRGLKSKDTPILKGMQVYHNFIRPHSGLEGKTPAEACGIRVEGENKWLTLIQNAASKKKK